MVLQYSAYTCILFLCVYFSLPKQLAKNFNGENFLIYGS